jgi:SAM-dependent methyltransferase
VPEWFKEWFDQDYAAIYAGRGPEEAGTAVAMALERAPALASGPVLDLACGSGRHLEVLRRTNPLAFGLDLSRDLLALAPESLRPWLLRGDMRHLPVREGSLAGVCLWFTPFGYFSDEQNRQLLQDVRRLLHPGGVLLLDYLNAAHVRANLVGEDEALHHGLRVVSRRALEGQRIVKRMVLTRLDTGATRKVTESVRLYDPSELVAMARGCGLDLFSEAGDYGGAPFSGTQSSRWIGFLRRNGVD